MLSLNIRSKINIAIPNKILNLLINSTHTYQYRPSDYQINYIYLPVLSSMSHIGQTVYISIVFRSI